MGRAAEEGGGLLERLLCTEAERAAVEEVRRLAGEKLAQAEQVLRQIDAEYSAPPYDPFLVAQALGIRCRAVEAAWLEDAMISVQEGEPTILYRPDRSAARTRFNIFHEIAHTLFPDYQYNALYRRTARPRLFEPEGQLEHLCDVAAAEFMMPMEAFRSDLLAEGFGAGRVPGLCRRYGASVEAVCLRMIEADVECCALVLCQDWRPERRRREAGHQVRVAYAATSGLFRRTGIHIPPCLVLEGRSCIHLASRSKKPASGEERVPLGGGREREFRMEALPLTARRRRHGRTPVLAFLYPL